MGELSEIESRKTRLPLEIPIPASMLDHHFQGRAVFPAVEAMQVLAASTQSCVPDVSATCIRDAGFDKFLFLPSLESDEHDTAILSAWNDLEILENGDVISKLITRTRSPRAAITRTREHVTVRFHWQNVIDDLSPPGFQKMPPPGEGFDIPSETIYEEMVPFGLSYRNIRDRVFLSESCAVADVHAAPFPSLPGPLGSPFPLDAAFHAACAWGQRYAGIVAFPVGLDRRHILRPTRPGETYRAVVRPLNDDPGLLQFDIALYTADGVLCESAAGVRMRDVSGGRMKPPEWVVKQ